MEKVRFDQLNIFSFAFLGLCMGLLIWFNFACSPNILDADASSELVLAKLLNQEGKIVTSSWYYSTELRLLNTQLVMAPLFSVFQEWSVIRAVGNCILYMILIFSYVFLMKAIKIEKKWIWLTTSLLFMPISFVFLNIVYIGAFYIPHIIMSFLCMGIFLRIVYPVYKVLTRKWVAILSGVFIVFSVVAGMSGIRYLMTIQTPIFLTSLIMLLRDCIKNRSKEFKRRKTFLGLIMGAAGLISALVGYIVNDKIISQVYSFQSQSDTQLMSSAGDVIEKIKIVFSGFLEELFNFKKTAADMAGVLNNVLVIVLFVALGVVLFQAIRYVCSSSLKISCKKSCGGALCDSKTPTQYNSNDSKSAGHIFLIWMFIMAFGLCWIIFGITKTYVFAARWFIPALAPIIPVVAIYFDCEKTRVIKVLVGTIIIGCMFSMSCITLETWSKKDLNTPRYPYIQYLEENDLYFGYANFWDANITTELTDGKIQVAGMLDINEMIPYQWLVPKDYFQAEYHTGSSFVLLAKKNEEHFQERLKEKGGHKGFDDGTYVIYQFDPNDSFAVTQ